MSVLAKHNSTEPNSTEPGSKRTYLPAEARRAQILERAREVFGRLGYQLASVADICEAARIGRGTLYQYFGNKREVFRAVLDEIAKRVAQVIAERPALASIPGAEAVPTKLIVAYCERRLRMLLSAVFSDEASLRLLLHEARGQDGGIDGVIQSIDRAVLGALVEDLIAARKLGLIDCPEPALTAEFVIGGVEKMVLRALENDEPIDLDAIVRVATRIQLYGLLTESTRRR